MPPEDTNASPGCGAAIIKGSAICVNCQSFVAKKGDSYNQQKQSVTSKINEFVSKSSTNAELNTKNINNNNKAVCVCVCVCKSLKALRALQYKGG